MLSNRPSILEGLEMIGLLGGKAEALTPDQLLHSTLPIPNHMNFLEPDILLIVGGRGAGKSHLFRLINMKSGQKVLSAGKHQLENAIWIKGFHTLEPENAPTSLYFPGETVLQRFTKGKEVTDLLDFWRGLLLGSILKQVDPELCEIFRAQLPDSLSSALSDLANISIWHKEIVDHLESVELALNKFDEILSNEKRFLFVTYDDLDVMAVEWNEKRALVQSLLRFWLGQWRRWRRIRPKIFLRSDLFSEEFLKFPDASKLEANKTELHWKYTQLYQLSFKSWANRNSPSLNFLQNAGLNMFNHPILGWTYYSESLPSEDVLRGVVHRMMGQYMGSGPTKGRTFEWVPNHLQDANGEIVPRSMLNLLALAAKDEVANKRIKDTNLLLSPLSIRGVLEEVSAHRVTELAEEYPWLDVIKSRFQGKQVPMGRLDFINLLEGINWSLQEPNNHPVSQEPSKIVDNLLKIGVLRLTSDQRIHVPDIYLYGFRMKRKGGTRRPN